MEEGQQVGHCPEQGPGLDLLMCRQYLQQVLGQQHHLGVEACDDAPSWRHGSPHPIPQPPLALGLALPPAADSGDASVP